MKIQIKLLIALCIIVFPILLTPYASAKISDLKLEADPFQYENGVFKEWSSDMKKIGITTKERGLVFRVTVTNINNEPYTNDELTIDVRVEKVGSVGSTFHEQVSNYIYLPPNEKTEIDIPVDFGGGDAIGSYSAEIQCSGIGYVTENVEPYPFEFRVLGEDQFQKELEEKEDSPLINIGDINITVEIIGGISVTIIGALVITWYMRRKR